MKGFITVGAMKFTSWGMIVIQTFFPLLVSFSSVASANDHSVHMDKQSAAAQEPAVLSSEKNTPNFPTLGSDSVPSEGDTDPSVAVAGNVMQLGQTLSGDDAPRASMYYAKSLGEGLINQQVEDWLNQKGAARISTHFNQHITGDFLLPLKESADSLFFSQAGLHTDGDRNIADVGVGYRQYIGIYMFGTNIFYDYDYTGNNKRLGVGAEVWADYLKLAANGYYGLNNWHQALLSEMRDFDERPARGFDLRASANLPSYPQLGVHIKYEQYFW